MRDGSLHSFIRHTNGEVKTLALSDSIIYIGGKFKTIANQKRYNLAALDMVSGKVTNFNPVVDGEVHALLLESILFVGSIRIMNLIKIKYSYSHDVR